MADRRGVRSSSRRKTPTPQPEFKADTAQVGRASRTRALRSASRDAELVTVEQKATRRSTRQTSVATISDDSDHEALATRNAKRRHVKEAVGELTVVEEVDTQINLEDAPGTPTHTQSASMAPFRSPGAASEMSGTTAISSFSMVEADFLEPRFILRHLRKLCDSADEFLEHLAPDGGSLEGDLLHIHEIQRPDAEFTEDYRDFSNELMVHLVHFKTDGNAYIHIRALHRALFGVNSEIAATESGLDLILYLANVLIFAKQMIHSDRTEKEIWDALRQLDNSFPSQFMQSLIPSSHLTSAGESAMLQNTFDLALDLRTQLAILVLERSSGENGFNPDEVLREVFYRSEPSQETTNSTMRGWNIPALGGEDSALPQSFQEDVVKRIETMRAACNVDTASMDQGEGIDLEGLGASFPWEATILRLLHWVRLRRRELSNLISKVGGATAILRNVKQALEGVDTIDVQAEAAIAARESPRRTRKSFRRDRRRSSRKFDPNAPVDVRAIDALKARERLSEASTATVEQEGLLKGAEVEVIQNAPSLAQHQDDASLFVSDAEQDQPGEQLQGQLEGQTEKNVAELTGPPTSSMAILEALKAASKPEKENRVTSIFDRQTNAQRIDFGDGFDTQPTPEPSVHNKGKERAMPLPSKKRARTLFLDSDSDEDAFEAEDRTAGVNERRERAPVVKRVRIDPSSSGAPPSHQPPPRSSHNTDNKVALDPEPGEGSLSEPEAPNMTEEPPPASIYRSQSLLAKQNRTVLSSQQARKAPTAWSVEEEEAFIRYMEKFPARYSAILKYDEQEGHEVLQNRSQVNLKDKARNMAMNMIKSGTGLLPGFEEVVKYNSKIGVMLREQGYEW